MYSRVLVFENKKKDQQEFEKIMKAVGCDVKIIDKSTINPKIDPEHKEIAAFKPQLAIVDSKFESDIDGLDTVRYLNENFPGIPMVICSILLDAPEKDKKEWIFNQYHGLPGVRGIIGKNPFPTGQQILDLCR
jgi:CheY-like chemotaxis protein